MPFFVCEKCQGLILLARLYTHLQKPLLNQGHIFLKELKLFCTILALLSPRPILVAGTLITENCVNIHLMSQDD